MKFTKQQLAQIINEEAESIQKEGFFGNLFGKKKKKPVSTPAPQSEPEAAPEPEAPKMPSSSEQERAFGKVIAELYSSWEKSGWRRQMEREDTTGLHKKLSGAYYWTKTSDMYPDRADLTKWLLYALGGRSSIKDITYEDIERLEKYRTIAGNVRFAIDHPAEPRPSAPASSSGWLQGTGLSRGGHRTSASRHRSGAGGPEGYAENKKITISQLGEIIKEEIKQLAKEEADPSAVDSSRFPKHLSRVSPKASKILSRSGASDGDTGPGSDDAINVTHNASIAPVANLIPSQNSMNVKKAVSFVINMLSDKAPDFKPGGDLGAFISKGQGGLYIMDGHHRWIATGMINPSLKMGGYLVDFPPEELVAVLNTITKGRLNIQKGKPGKGSFAAFNEAGIKPILQKFAQQGVPWGATTPEDVIAALQKLVPGVPPEQVVDAAAKKIGKNLSKLTLKAPGWAPSRPDMPVIDKDQVAAALQIAVKAMKNGEVDVNPPYAQTGRKFTDTAGTDGKDSELPGQDDTRAIPTAKDSDEKRRAKQDKETQDDRIQRWRRQSGKA